MAKKSFSRLMYFISETHDFQKQQSVIVVNLVGPLVRENESILQECIDSLGRSQARWLIFNFRDVPFESLSPGIANAFYEWQLEARKRGMGLRFSGLHPQLRDRFMNLGICSSDELVDNLAIALQTLSILSQSRAA